MTSWVGIDISKASLSIAIHPQRISFTVANDCDGHKLALTQLAALQVERVVMEATGGMSVASRKRCNARVIGWRASTLGGRVTLQQRWENWPRPIPSTRPFWHIWHRSYKILRACS